MEYVFKEVYFDEYCKTCEHCYLEETEDPCFECLVEHINSNSHKPVNWKGKNK